ncbi:histidine phosphatase family protein [Candidatus Poriferisodalis sp.]|uniref:histidine phosphatase family protein n=1 Tax=Candidatus Poriferisodalis sp. TaxID=3101277 RepID=UPI003B015EB6
MLILVRHGRTSANAAGLLQGRIDHELDEVGAQQAEQIAMALANGDHRPEAIVTSPLTRAVQTAAATARQLGLMPSVDERWAELAYGDWDGVAISAVPPQAWLSWRADPAFAPPRGESLAELNVRITGACEELAAQASQRNIAVFTHVSPIKSAVRWALGTDEEISWRMHVAQAQITCIGFRNGAPTLQTFNDTSHLSSRT